MKLSSIFKSKNNGQNFKGVVLMYHRIADAVSDPFELAVSEANFKEQLIVLQRYNLLSIDDFYALFTKRKSAVNAITITFDDGYLDNYLIAKPLLEKYKSPATFFITTGQIGVNREFWWDALQRICIETEKLPPTLTIVDTKFFWQIGNGKNEINRSELYHQLCEILKSLPAIEHQNLILYLEDWAQNHSQRAAYLSMGNEELLSLSKSNLFTLGAHTKTHAFLPNFQLNYQQEDIFASIITIEQLTKKEVKYFAYPHGGCNDDTINIMEKSGINMAFTTASQIANEHSYKFTMPRFQVKNWDGRTFENHLKLWLEANN